MDNPLDREDERLSMVREQIEHRGLHEARLLQAMRTVPRHRFVLEEEQEWAYDDGPLPIGNGQTISQPYIVALMTSLAVLQGDENVLEVGSGSGYQAAILSLLAACVHSIELIPHLAERSARTLSDLGYTNVHIHTGDGSLGWPDASPYDAILVTAASPGPHPTLLDQLKPGGRLVIPVGQRPNQVLQRWTRQDNAFIPEDIIPVAFVPLRGVHGWKEQEWY
jgi:protein-L-isoaspartate(D-aspartate) O-methyltransferase